MALTTMHLFIHHHASFIVHYRYDNYNYYGFNFVRNLPLCVHICVSMTV